MYDDGQLEHLDVDHTVHIGLYTVFPGNHQPIPRLSLESDCSLKITILDLRENSLVI